MSTHKRINDKYTITAPDVVINGNLLVVGSTANVSATNTEIKDNIIVLNKGETGNGITLGTAGISVDRGIGANVSIVYTQSANVWSLTNDGVNYFQIAAVGGGGFLTAVVDDTNPQLGGNLNVADFSLISSNANVTVSATMRLLNQAGYVLDAQPSDATLFYANTVGNGGTGLYVNNSQVLEKEIITKDRSIFWSMVL